MNQAKNQTILGILSLLKELKKSETMGEEAKWRYKWRQERGQLPNLSIKEGLLESKAKSSRSIKNHKHLCTLSFMSDYGIFFIANYSCAFCKILWFFSVLYFSHVNWEKKYLLQKTEKRKKNHYMIIFTRQAKYFSYPS